MTDYSSKKFFIQPSKSGTEDFEDLINRDYHVDISKWLCEGWDLFKKDAGLSIAFAVIAAISYALFSFIVPMGGVLIGLPLIAGIMIVSLMLVRNQQYAFKNYFWGFRHFLPLLIFTIVSTVFITLGLILLIIPGLYLTVAYLFSPYLIVDKNIDFWPAMEISRRKMNRHWFGMFAFCVVIILLNLVGCIPVFLGLFITLPYSICAMTAAYKDIFTEGTVVPLQDVMDS